MLICALSFFFKQKTAYEMRISDWSSDVCSSDLRPSLALALALDPGRGEAAVEIVEIDRELVGGDEFLVGCRRLFLLLVEGRIGRALGRRRLVIGRYRAHAHASLFARQVEFSEPHPTVAHRLAFGRTRRPPGRQ